MLASEISHPLLLPPLKRNYSEGSLLLLEANSEAKENGDHFGFAPRSPAAGRSGSGNLTPVAKAAWEFESLSCPPSVSTSKNGSPVRRSPAERRVSVEVAGMREWLRDEGFPEADEHFSDAYLTLVMGRFKDGKQRTFEYSAEKLADALRLRREYDAPNITRADVARSLAPGHMWWGGEDRIGRPILCVRPARMDLATYNTDEYLRAHVFLIEEGLATIRKKAQDQEEGEKAQDQEGGGPGLPVESFVMVVDASGLGVRHFDIHLMKAMLKLATTAYPDRLGCAVIAPVNMIVRSCWALLSKLMSPTMAGKIALGKSLRPMLTDLMPEGSDDQVREILFRLQGGR